MKIVVFGLTVSSSWGNGHATLWRGLCRSLARLGHHVVFFERDVSYYAQTRDLFDLPGGGDLVLYTDWEEVRLRAAREITEADAGIVTSYCPDALEAADLLTDAARPLKVFYDLDTPVTLARLSSGESVPYIGRDKLSPYDLVLSYTGGAALDALRADLGARKARPLYGHVDPATHRPVAPSQAYRADFSYIGTYAADRQAALDALFLEPARAMPESRFVIAGAQYPAEFPWSANIFFVRHLSPAEHPAFFASSRLTLNITRAAMARMGWCPSGRLFEAAACGTALVTDVWEGLEAFFAPGREIIAVRDGADVESALALGDEEVRRIAAAARERVLAEHTSDKRAGELVAELEAAWKKAPVERTEA